MKDKSEHSWYYNSILNNIKQICDTDEYKEFKQLVIDVFN